VALPARDSVGGLLKEGEALLLAANEGVAGADAHGVLVAKEDRVWTTLIVALAVLDVLALRSGEDVAGAEAHELALTADEMDACGDSEPDVVAEAMDERDALAQGEGEDKPDAVREPAPPEEAEAEPQREGAGLGHGEAEAEPAPDKEGTVERVALGEEESLGARLLVALTEEQPLGEAAPVREVLAPPEALPPPPPISCEGDTVYEALPLTLAVPAAADAVAMALAVAL